MFVKEFNLNRGYLHNGSKYTFLKVLGSELFNFEWISLSISSCVPRNIPLIHFSEGRAPQ